MTSPGEARILHQTKNHHVLSAGRRGFEVYRREGVAAVKVASIGHGPAPRLGLARAIAECERREA